MRGNDLNFVLSAKEAAAFDPSVQGFCSECDRACQTLPSRHPESQFFLL